VEEGWGCLFTRLHSTLKGCLGRKWSAEVLVGLQAMGSVHLALALPTQRQRALQKGYPDLIQKLTMLSIPIWLRVWHKNKSTKFMTKIESLVRNSGQDPSRGRNLCFHVRYSNGNILSFWYRNQAIQKLKFIYASRTTTLMKESKWDEIVLENRIWQ
jgi:hypothetical protein